MPEHAVPSSPTASSASRSHSISDDGVPEANIVQARRLTTTRSMGALTAARSNSGRGDSDGPGDASFSAVMDMSMPVPPMPPNAHHHSRAVARPLRVLASAPSTPGAGGGIATSTDTEDDGQSQHAVYPQDHLQFHPAGMLSSPSSIRSSPARAERASTIRLASSSSALSSPFHARSGQHDGEPRRSASAMTSPVFALSPNPNSGSASAQSGFETLRGGTAVASRSSAAIRQDGKTGGDRERAGTVESTSSSSTPAERMKRSASLSSRPRREPRESERTERTERSDRTAGKTSSASTITPAPAGMSRSSSSGALLGPSTSRSAASSNSGTNGSTALPVKELKQPLLPSADLVSTSRPWSISTPYWSKATVWGKLPNRPMRAHTATLVHDEDDDSGEASIWVFGGCDAKTCFRDAWRLDLDTYQWSKPKLRGSHPPSLRAHSATYIPPFVSHAPGSSGTATKDGHIILFGGGDGPSYFNDLYLLNLRQNAWSKPQLFGEIPSARRAHTAVWYEPKKWLVVFGGGNGSRALNDTHVLECKRWDRLNWRKVETKGRKPRLRGYHTMNLVGDKAIIFGGSDGVECFSDVFILDLSTFRWSEILVYSPSLHCPRLSHSATLLSSTRLLILGGHDGSDYASTLVVFNLTSGRFEEVAHAGIGPSKRGYHSATAHDGRVTLIGGFDGKRHFDDTWTLDIGAWSDLAV